MGYLSLRITPSRNPSRKCESWCWIKARTRPVRLLFQSGIEPLERNAICVVLCTALLLAQQPPLANPPEVVFSGTTTRVQVDAVVTDSKGHYVTDLTADDFAIYDDGKSQKIT